MDTLMILLIALLASCFSYGHDISGYKMPSEDGEVHKGGVLLKHLLGTPDEPGYDYVSSTTDTKSQHSGRSRDQRSAEIIPGNMLSLIKKVLKPIIMKAKSHKRRKNNNNGGKRPMVEISPVVLPKEKNTTIKSNKTESNTISKDEGLHGTSASETTPLPATGTNIVSNETSPGNVSETSSGNVSKTEEIFDEQSKRKPFEIKDQTANEKNNTLNDDLSAKNVPGEQPEDIGKPEETNATISPIDINEDKKENSPHNVNNKSNMIVIDTKLMEGTRAHRISFEKPITIEELNNYIIRRLLHLQVTRIFETVSEIHPSK